jgi:hypothetical protein
LPFTRQVGSPHASCSVASGSARQILRRRSMMRRLDALRSRTSFGAAGVRFFAERFAATR